MSSPEVNIKLIDSSTLRTNYVVQAHCEFAGKVGEGFPLKIIGVTKTSEGKVFRLRDLVGRSYQVTADEIASGGQGVMRFDGFSNGPTTQMFDKASSCIVNNVYKKPAKAF